MQPGSHNSLGSQRGVGQLKMRLAVVLLLVTSQLNVPGESQKTEVSCEDKDVFRAVDAALTEYNSQKASGNQFVLHQIITVSLTESSTFTITYNIQEGDCHVKMGKNWKECGIKEALNKDHGQCTAIVKSQNENEFTITKQHCEIIPVNDEVIPVDAPCLGCYKPISANDEDLQEVLNNAVQQFNYESQSDHLYTLKDVSKALRQVEPEEKHSIEIQVKETECSKEKGKFSEDCEFKKDGRVLKCTVQVPMEQDGEVKPVVDCHELPSPAMVLVKRPPGFSPFRAAAVIPAEETIATSEPQNFNTTEQEEEQTPGKGTGYPHGYGHGQKKGHHPVHGNKNHPGFGLGHKHGPNHSHGRHRGHDLGHGHKNKHGQGHQKHGKKNKKSHEGWTDEDLHSPSEDNFPPSLRQEENQSPPQPQSPSQQGVAVTPSYFQDLDLLVPNPTNIPAEPTAEKKTGGEEVEEEDWIPDIPIEPKNPLFTLVPDFPEPVVPKCPGSPWQPIAVMNPVTEESQDGDFDLSDALSFSKK
ncbi:kininogen-1 [Gracilinanus agilis]|uniref:kininogen-1 n=1 Tax=Gracilinanus agilis TaxID=191870 RepID=UPI001CFDC085|nr:kininogen-1 [Gracilinanus agilis]